MIVVEGADLVGKSTLVKAIVNELRLRGRNYATCHLGRLAPGDRENEYYELMRFRQVWDRFHVSEVCYRAHDDIECCIPVESFNRVTQEIQENFGGIIVVMCEHAETIKARYEKIGDDIYDLERILDVNRSFKEIACSHHTKCRDNDYALRPDIAYETTPRDTEYTARVIVDLYDKNFFERYGRSLRDEN